LHGSADPLPVDAHLSHGVSARVGAPQAVGLFVEQTLKL